MSNKTLTIGVAVDDFKIQNFVAELTKYDFEISSVDSLGANVSVIKIIIELQRLNDLKGVIQTLETNYN